MGRGLSDMSDKTAFAKQLRTLLDEKGMRHKELAEKTGVHEAAISLFCRGKRLPKDNTLQKIAEVLNVSTDELLGNTQPKEAVMPEKVVRVGPYEYGMCPGCHSMLDTLGNPNYCGHCGLAVKWG